MKKTAVANKLNVTALAMAFGLTWGVFIFLLTLTAMCWGWGSAFVALLSDVYIGVVTTWFGAVMALVWGFVDGFIGGLVFALLYNFFAPRFK